MNKFKMKNNTSKNKQEVKAQKSNRLKTAYITTKKMNNLNKNKNPKQYKISNGQNTIDQYSNKKINDDYLFEDFNEKKNMEIKNEKKQNININKNTKVRNMSSKMNNRYLNKNNNNKISNKNIKIRSMSSNKNNRNMNNKNMNKNIYIKNLDKIFINNYNNNNNNMNYNIYNFNINRNNIKSNNEMLVKKKFDLNEWIKKSIKSNPNQKEKEKILQKNIQLEIAFKFELKEKIEDIMELSNQRIGIKISNQLKIYSLKTFQLITTIDDDGLNNKYLELENRDLARKCFKSIQFFKLTGNKYHLFQTIEENDIINSITKLMNGNLLLTCNDKNINIYGKEGNEYKLLTQNFDEKDCKDAIEIEENKVIIFKEYYNDDDENKSKYLIFFYDILSRNKKILMDDFFLSGDVGREYLNMVINEKYLFVNFNVYSLSYNCYNRVKRDIIYDKINHRIIERTRPFSLIPPEHPIIGYIFNLGKKQYLKCEYDNFPDKSGEEFRCKPIKDKIRDEQIYDSEKLLLEFKIYQFIFEKFSIKLKNNYFKIVNLKNNNFIFCLGNKIILIKAN